MRKPRGTTPSAKETVMNGNATPNIEIKEKQNPRTPKQVLLHQDVKFFSPMHP